MNFYIVMQGRTYIEEKQHGVICSLTTDKKGEPMHFWERMKDVQVGDILFHFVKGEIVALSTVSAPYRTGQKPYGDDVSLHYIVETKYEPLDVPFSVKPAFAELAPFMPIKYSAFQENGDGNQGFLYPCNEYLTLKLLEIISDINIYDEDEQLEFAMGPILVNNEDTLMPLLIEAEAKALKKLRKHRTKFADELAPLWHHQCALCEIDRTELLEACYCKPWKDATDEERLDANNGVLLCKNHAALYNAGLIAFDGTGKIHISQEITEEDYAKYNLHAKMRIDRTAENKPYLKWHKREVFKG